MLRPEIAEMLRGEFPGWLSESCRYMTVLNAYFDDSGTHGSSPIVTVAGFFATASQWFDFDKKWNRVLHDGLLAGSELPEVAPTLTAEPLADFLAPVIAELALLHPRLRIYTSYSDRRVDLIAERFDVAKDRLSPDLIFAGELGRRDWTIRARILKCSENVMQPRHGVTLN